MDLKNESTTECILLFDRLDSNFTDFRDSMISASKQYVFDMAEEIATRYAAREYMKTGYDYKTGEVEYLLQFQNPLEIIANGWPSTLDGIADMSNAVADILKNKSSHGHYARIMDADNPAANEGTRTNAEKPSVLAQIRAAEREPREPHRGKPVRDGLLPEL